MGTAADLFEGLLTAAVARHERPAPDRSSAPAAPQQPRQVSDGSDQGAARQRLAASRQRDRGDEDGRAPARVARGTDRATGETGRANGDGVETPRDEVATTQTSDASAGEVETTGSTIDAPAPDATANEATANDATLGGTGSDATAGQAAGQPAAIVEAPLATDLVATNPVATAAVGAAPEIVVPETATVTPATPAAATPVDTAATDGLVPVATGAAPITPTVAATPAPDVAQAATSSTTPTPSGPEGQSAETNTQGSSASASPTPTLQAAFDDALVAETTPAPTPTGLAAQAPVVQTQPVQQASAPPSGTVTVAVPTQPGDVAVDGPVQVTVTPADGGDSATDDGTRQGSGNTGNGGNGGAPAFGAATAPRAQASAAAVATLLTAETAATSPVVTSEAPAPEAPRAPTQTTPPTLDAAQTLGDDGAGHIASSSNPQGPQAEAGARQASVPGRPAQVLLPLAAQVAGGLSRLSADGGGQINIKLAPANLGQVEVSMRIQEDGRVSATIVADRPETLDLLRRDAWNLERALGEAGLKADSGSLQFSLRGESGREGGRDGHGGRTARAPEADDITAADAAQPGRRRGLGMLDLRI